MNQNLSLFDEGVEEQLPTVVQARPLKTKNGLTTTLELPLAHPYARYGLAVALYSNSRLSTEQQKHPEALDEATVRESLAGALESGLESFRMRTGDDPLLERLLSFAAIPLTTLQSKPTWVQSSGLASQGIYIFPTVVTTDGDARGTFENAISLMEALRGTGVSSASRKYSRSFAPTTAKINNGTASQSEPKGTLIETACAAITTLTPLKPAAWSERNTVIIPDISLSELLDFIGIFEAMTLSETGKGLWQAQLPPLATATGSKAKKPKEGVKPKSDYRRPRMFGGNYPFAPRDANAFGAVGLLAAIGRWAVSAGEADRGRRVLESLAQAPLYIVSYDKIAQVRFQHHIVSLSIESHLSETLDALWRETQLYADLDSPRINRQNPAYQIFYLQTSRFLQSFSRASFRDFLAARAEYPAALEPILRAYFHQNHMNISSDVVASAGALGQWLNLAAYVVANGEVEGQGASPDRAQKVRKVKAKILVEFESAALSAKSPQDLLFRISTRAGRLLQDDAPASAKRFMDAVASGEILQNDAVHLLVAYMRLRAPRKETGEPSLAPEADAPMEEAPAEIPE